MVWCVPCSQSWAPSWSWEAATTRSSRRAWPPPPTVIDVAWAMVARLVVHRPPGVSKVETEHSFLNALAADHHLQHRHADAHQGHCRWHGTWGDGSVQTGQPVHAQNFSRRRDDEFRLEGPTARSGRPFRLRRERAGSGPKPTAGSPPPAGHSALSTRGVTRCCRPSILLNATRTGCSPSTTWNHRPRWGAVSCSWARTGRGDAQPDLNFLRADGRHSPRGRH